MSASVPATERPLRLAVVSGGGTGIGLATARALVGDGTGVVLVGRRQEVLDRAAAELAAAPRPAHPGDGAVPIETVAADLAEAGQLPRVLAAVDAAGGRVDVVVANAGAGAPRSAGSLADVAEQWTTTYRTNVLTAVLLVEALAPRLARPGGRVVVISSAAALQGNATPAYAAAKAALHGWVLALANRFGPEGITANAVAPGYTAGTELVAGRIPAARHERLVGFIAAGRPAEPDEIAAVVRSVAAPDASYLNGQVIAVDGGRRSI